MRNKEIGKILDGALSLTVSALVVKILGVIYKVPLSYILGDAGMGYFNTAYTVYGFFYVLCSAGVPKAITCIISESKTEDEVSGIFAYSLRFFILVGAALCGVLMLSAPLIVYLIGNEGALATLMVIGPSVLFVASGGVCRGYLAAAGRLSPIAISQVIEAVCKLAMGILFARIGAHISLPKTHIAALAVLGITFGSCLSALYLLLSCKIRITKYKAGQSKVKNGKEIVKRLLKIAVPITVGSSVLTLSSLIDMTLTMRCLQGIGIDTMEANEIYGNYTTLAVPMFNLVISLITPLTVRLLPELIKKRDDAREFGRELNRTLTITAALVAPCACVYYLYSFDLLDILFSSAQSARGFEMLSALAISLFFLCILNVTNTAHEANGRFGVPILSLSVGTLMKVIVEPLLILFTPLGVLGVPVSTLISHFVGLLISVVLLFKDGVRINLGVGCVLPMLASSLAFILTYRLIYPLGGFFGGLAGVITLWIMSSILYIVMLILCWWIAFRMENKVKMTKFLSRGTKQSRLFLVNRTK